MQVNLAELKAAIVLELQQVEERRSHLQQELHHIEAVHGFAKDDHPKKASSLPDFGRFLLNSNEAR